MKSIRIGNDIRIEWAVSTDGVTQVQDLDLAVEVRPSDHVVDWHNYVDAPTMHTKTHAVMLNGGAGQPRPGVRGYYPPMMPQERRPYVRPIPGGPIPPNDPRNALMPVQLPWYVEDGKIIALWTADKQFATGEYDIMLYAHKGGVGQAVVDQYRFVRLVAHTAMADAPDGTGVEAVIAMQPVTLQLNGLSAYEIAVKNGFVGTEEEWLNSLRMDTETARDYSAALAGATARFDGEVAGVTVTASDSTTELAVDSVWYDTEKKCFVGLKDGKYYTTWTGSTMYNYEGAARQDKLYVQGDAVYYWNTATQTLAKIEGGSGSGDDDDKAAGVATVNLDALDELKLDLKDHSKAGVYKVVQTRGSYELSVGTLLVSGDSWGHGTDQVLITNMLPNDDGELDGSAHQDSGLYIYHRYYNLSGAVSTPATGTWGAWTLVNTGGSGSTADSVAWDSVTGKPNIIATLVTAGRVLTQLSASGNKITAQGYNGNQQGVSDEVELKTINGESLIGSGNIVISGGSGETVDTSELEAAIDALEALAEEHDTVRFDGFVEGVTTETTGYTGNVVGVWYDTANKTFVATTSLLGSKYYNAWKGDTSSSAQYMGDGGVLQDKVYLCGSDVYVWSSTEGTLVKVQGSGSGTDSGLTLGETSTTAFAGDRGVELENDVQEINDILDAKNLPVAVPQLTVKNALYEADGTTLETDIPNDFVLNSASVNKVENGYKVAVDVSYKWTSDSSHKDPTAITSDSMVTELTKSGVQSASKQETISAGKTYKVSLTAPKTGLMVSGSSVVKASGVDTSTASVTYQFLHRVFYGAAADGADITTLAGNALQSGKGLTVQGVTTGETEKYIYAYPKSLGDLTSVLQDGVTPVLTAFTKTTATVTNGAGLQIEYNVYTSNNVGAFTGVKLQFA